ncbi:MAG: DNA starvation/stationary phase protection protein [Ilumatobacteraceae bacterium]
MASSTRPSNKRASAKRASAKRASAKRAAKPAAAASAPSFVLHGRRGRRHTSENVSSVSSTRQTAKTVPGIERADGAEIAAILQRRLVAYVDLSLTLKHVHWNVVGPAFIGVHEMLDPQYAAVQLMVDGTAERIATLGSSPNGLPGSVASTRGWDDYELGRADVQSHLAALDLVYDGVIESARGELDQLEELDAITHDMVVAQIAQLEQFQWFVRAHLEDAAGGTVAMGEKTELGAATKAARAARR